MANVRHIGQVLNSQKKLYILPTQQSYGASIESAVNSLI